MPVLQAKVDPPNYDFSLDRLKKFIPGNSLQKALDQGKNGQAFNAQTLSEENGYKITKIYIKHVRYKFPLLLQSSQGQITDFYARLPAYFLHDIFHQSLINRLGPQDIYKKVEEHAVYVWKSKESLNHVYSGACSITCFPVYYSVYPEKGAGGNYRPLVKRLTDQELAKLSKD